MIDFSKEFAEIKTVLENIKKGEQALIIAHSDADGITSAYVLSRILEKYGLEYRKDYNTWLAENATRSFIKEDEKTRNLINKNQYVFFVDYSLEDYSFIKGVSCTIDHHKIESKAKIQINPAGQVESLKVPSASALVYALYDYLFGEDELVKKIAFIGALGDLMVFNSLPYLKTNENDEDFFVQRLPQITYYQMSNIFNLKNVDKKNDTVIYEYMLESLKGSVMPLLFLPNEFKSKIEKVKKAEVVAIKKALDRVVKYEEQKIVILETNKALEPYFERLKSVMHALFPRYSTFTITKLPNKLGYRFSARSQKNIDLVKFVEYLKTKIPDLRGGGHPFAAGFFCKPKQLKKVKKEIIENANNFPRTN